MINFNLFFCSKNDDKLDRKEYQNAAILKEHVSLKIQEILDSISKEMQLKEGQKPNEEQQKLFAQKFYDSVRKYKESLEQNKETGIAFEGKVPIDVAIHTAELMEFWGSICIDEEVKELAKKILLVDLIFNINTALFTVFSILLFFFAFQIGKKEYYSYNSLCAKAFWKERFKKVGNWDKLVVLSVILVPFIIIAIEKIFFLSEFTIKEFIENIDPERIGDLKKQLESSSALFCSIFSAMIFTSMLFVYLFSKYFLTTFSLIADNFTPDVRTTKILAMIILLFPVLNYLVFIAVMLFDCKFIFDTNNIHKFSEFANMYQQVLSQQFEANFSPSINTQKENTKPEKIEEAKQPEQMLT